MSSLPKTVVDVFVHPGVDVLENVTDDVDGKLNENAEGCTSDKYEVNSISAFTKPLSISIQTK